MFTGITEEIGEIKDFTLHTNGALVEVSCQKVLSDTKIGDSILVNGVCTTIVEMTPNSFKADISQETLNVTTFSKLKAKEKVNLERAMALTQRLGGHIISGHTDCTAKILEIKNLGEFYNFKFEIKNGFEKYVIKKGSIAVNGISLTIANIENKMFECAIIPHTFENTVLKYLQKGDIVNIETDLFAKYIEKLLLNNEVKSNINENFLRENGFC